MMDAALLEQAARDARRKADIAKHTPLSPDQLDAYGEAQIRIGCKAQIELLNMASDLQNAYAYQLKALGETIRILRAEAALPTIRQLPIKVRGRSSLPTNSNDQLTGRATDPAARSPSLASGLTQHTAGVCCE